MSTGESEPTRGNIESVTGRADGRGVPELHHAVLRLDDGSTIEARMPTPSGEARSAYPLPFDFCFTEFDECPICLDALPTSREHVPPHSIGGAVLTLTCERCNNEFGSKFEPHLRGWYDGSIGQVRMSGGDVQGNRVAGEYLLRESSSGEFVLFQQGESDPAVETILRSGTFSLSYPEVDLNRVHVAMVKSAYLAACIVVGEVPRLPRSQAIREELVLLRDIPRHDRLVLSETMRSIRYARSAAEPVTAQIRLMAMPTGTTLMKYVISFNQVFAVDWPLDPIAVEVQRNRDTQA